MASKLFVFAALAVSCALAYPGHSVDYYVRLRRKGEKVTEIWRFVSPSRITLATRSTMECKITTPETSSTKVKFVTVEWWRDSTRWSSPMAAFAPSTTPPMISTDSTPSSPRPPRLFTLPRSLHQWSTTRRSSTTSRLFTSKSWPQHRLSTSMQRQPVSRWELIKQSIFLVLHFQCRDIKIRCKVGFPNRNGALCSLEWSIQSDHQIV